MTAKEEMEYFKDYNTKHKPNNLLKTDKGLALDAHVYRVFSLRYFLELFEKKENTLVKPEKWDDPWENFLLKQEIAGHPSNFPVSLEGIRSKYYGQCWTFKNEEDDALWRIYSPQKDGIRVKTTLGKLWDEFYDVNNKTAAIAYFLGEVQYLTEAEIKDYFEKKFLASNIAQDQSGKTIIYSLLYKREEFKHEKELRLIYCTDNNASPLYKYKIDPNVLIEEVLFDSRMDDIVFEAIKYVLINKYKFNGVIKKSSLYQGPNLKIKW